MKSLFFKKKKKKKIVLHSEYAWRESPRPRRRENNRLETCVDCKINGSAEQPVRGLTVRVRAFIRGTGARRRPRKRKQQLDQFSRSCCNSKVRDREARPGQGVEFQLLQPLA
jgi:hypothetical protein